MGREECEDLHVLCPDWSKSGLCKPQNDKTGFMKKSCRLSCRFCGGLYHIRLIYFQYLHETHIFSVFTWDTWRQIISSLNYTHEFSVFYIKLIFFSILHKTCEFDSMIAILCSYELFTILFYHNLQPNKCLSRLSTLTHFNIFLCLFRKRTHSCYKYRKV